MLEARSAAEFAGLIGEGGFDFLDFGCSRGGSIRWAMKSFGGKRGLGIDINPNKVAEARGAGFDAINFDILQIPQKPLVDFVVMNHFLEHVPDFKMVQEIIKRACDVSRRFVVIKQPFFDADGYLLQHGLKLYWSHWRGHPNTMSSFDLYRIFANLAEAGAIAGFSIHAKGPIQNSSHPAIHPVSSPRDQHSYDPTQHPPKPDKTFASAVYSETMALAWKDCGDPRELARRLRPDALMFAQY
jgi:SAM-dependent methyltransferase